MMCPVHALISHCSHQYQAASKLSKEAEAERAAVQTELDARQRAERFWAQRRVNAAQDLQRAASRLAESERQNAQIQFRARMPRAPWSVRYQAQMAEMQNRRLQQDVQRAKESVDVATVRANQNKAAADEVSHTLG